ncbi:hypothetical protein [Mycobacteroides abscessus]|uniref:hypothetical protein n=1 Tax=Mycobacteroides abscessus TaxID=36809 RepID=UPI0009A636C9|nr:hypothetical protein [Mycobacteroides abscessus]SKI65511.1 Uncharacterised protein [Mycobacteroides abscessus subsp. abscessus]
MFQVEALALISVTVGPDDNPWVVRNPVTATVHAVSHDWQHCYDWIIDHPEARYVVIERKCDYRPFAEYVTHGLLYNAPCKTRSQAEQLTLI